HHLYGREENHRRPGVPPEGAHRPRLRAGRQLARGIFFLHEDRSRETRRRRKDFRRQGGVALETVFVGPAPRLALSVAGEGPLVLFLHGIGGHRHHWCSQIEALKRKYKAAAWDARGYGDSDDYE